jgi:hypothetical protein
LVLLAPLRRRRTRANRGTQTSSGAACAARHHPTDAKLTTRTNRRQAKNRFLWSQRCVPVPPFEGQPRACGSPTRTLFLHEDPHRGHAPNSRSIAVCAPDPRHNLIAPGDSVTADPSAHAPGPCSTLNLAQLRNVPSHPPSTRTSGARSGTQLLPTRKPHPLQQEVKRRLQPRRRGHVRRRS